MLYVSLRNDTSDTAQTVHPNTLALYQILHITLVSAYAGLHWWHAGRLVAKGTVNRSGCCNDDQILPPGGDTPVCFIQLAQEAATCTAVDLSRTRERSFVPNNGGGLVQVCPAPPDGLSPALPDGPG